METLRNLINIIKYFHPLIKAKVFLTKLKIKKTYIEISIKETKEQ